MHLQQLRLRDKDQTQASLTEKVAQKSLQTIVRAHNNTERNQEDKNIKLI